MILSTRALTVKYGGLIGIADVSVNIAAGTIVAIVGANGAGKSTFMKAVAGLLPPAKGQIIFDGADIGGMVPEKRARLGISLVPEDRGILINLSVGENLKLALSAGRNHMGDAAFDDALLCFPILKEFWSRPAGALSGGQQQMLAIGRALVTNPKLLLLDEPSLGLSPVVVDELFEVISGLRENGVTVALVEQFANRAIAIADYAYVMKNHEVVAEGTASDFADGSRMAATYLGAI